MRVALGILTVTSIREKQTHIDYLPTTLVAKPNIGDYVLHPEQLTPLQVVRVLVGSGNAEKYDLLILAIPTSHLVDLGGKLEASFDDKIDWL